MPFLRIFAYLFFVSTHLLSAQIIHSHNDYEQKNPFFDAYRLGYNSIEADLFLKNNEIYVAHDEVKISAERTFRNLYLEPLLQQISVNKGYPYAHKQTLILLLDLKKNGNLLMKKLAEMLLPYKKELRHVKIIISGDMPPPTAFAEHDKLFFFDGRRNVNYSKRAFKRIGMMSASFLDFEKRWNGQTPLKAETKQLIKQFVDENHAKNKPVRFWGTPNTSLAFETLYELKVDIIGTDNLEFLHTFKTQKKN